MILDISPTAYSELWMNEVDTVGAHSSAGHRALARSLQAAVRVGGKWRMQATPITLAYLRQELPNSIDIARDQVAGDPEALGRLSALRALLKRVNALVPKGASL